jgi:hypothetical protein
MKLMIMQFRQPAVTSCLLVPNIFLSSLFSNTVSLWCFSLNVRDKFSHLYKTRGKIIVQYNLIITLLDSGGEDKRFRTEW